MFDLICKSINSVIGVSFERGPVRVAFHISVVGFLIKSHFSRKLNEKMIASFSAKPFVMSGECH